MDSREVRRDLNELVDGELNDSRRRELMAFLDSSDPSAPGLRKLHEDLRNVKRMVRDTATRPLAPASLRSSIEGVTARAEAGSRRSRPRIASFRQPRLWAAVAALLTLGFAAWVFFAEPFAPRLAHADMVRLCSDEFGKTFPLDPSSSPCCELGANAELLSLSRSSDARIPRIPGAKLWRTVSCSLDGVCALRFDFLPDPEFSDLRPISVFAIPDRSLGADRSIYDGLPAGAVCVCLRSKDRTVFCFRERGVVFSVLASIGHNEFLARHHPLDRQ